MMMDSASSTLGGSKQVVSRRRVLRTTGTVTGTGICVALFGTSPVGAQQTLDFGDVAVGSSETQTISQPNPTERLLPVTGIEITGADADQFSVVDGDAPFTLRPDESCAVAIQFTPTSPGEKSAAVRVEIGGATSRTAGRLTGIGVDEATEQTGNGSAPDDSTASSSSPEVTADESVGDTTEDTTASDDASASEVGDGTDGPAGGSRSIGDDSSPEDVVTPPLEMDGSTRPDDGDPSIVLMLDFNDDGVIDFQDVLTLIRILG